MIGTSGFGLLAFLSLIRALLGGNGRPASESPELLDADVEHRLDAIERRHGWAR